VDLAKGLLQLHELPIRLSREHLSGSRASTSRISMEIGCVPDAARTPTLIQHGEKDERVPIPNAFSSIQD
jgi:hypothetical protein